MTGRSWFVYFLQGSDAETDNHMQKNPAFTEYLNSKATKKPRQLAHQESRELWSGLHDGDGVPYAGSPAGITLRGDKK